MGKKDEATKTETAGQSQEGPAAAAADATPPANPLRPQVPGVIPSRVAERFHMPAVKQLHYSAVFPDAVPQAHETAPGVFVNPDGSPFTPREITGGQFAAILLRIRGKFGGPIREVGVPLSTQPQDYPVKPHERVTERIEVVFDFEDEMQEFLAQFGNSTVDLQRHLLKQKGLDPRLYNAELSQPQTSAPSAFSHAKVG